MPKKGQVVEQRSVNCIMKFHLRKIIPAGLQRMEGRVRDDGRDTS